MIASGVCSTRIVRLAASMTTQAGHPDTPASFTVGAPCNCSFSTSLCHEQELNCRLALLA